jgi:glycosyltransferase involved in cell wall biosynthesis
VIDAFTSLYDSAVYDRGIARPGSLSARRYWWIDWLAVRLADVVLVDTDQHRDYFISEFGAPEARLRGIPVGASCEWFDTPTAQSSDDGMLISFYGTYIPLHGIDTILHAADLLSHQPHLRFEIIGRGQTYKAMQQLAATLNLLQVTFVDSVPAADLPGLVARADICLGIFGTTEKTTRVVPNKVYQTLALGKPVITADTPAVRELFTPDEHLTVVPAGDASALASAIEGLAADFERRAALSKAGRTYAAAEFSEQPLGRRLLEALA